MEFSSARGGDGSSPSGAAGAGGAPGATGVPGGTRATRSARTNGGSPFARVVRQVRSAVAGLFDQSQPFGRLALVHALFSAGTTLITISLAGSLFFNVSPHESKSKVLLYLLLTIAPFAIVAPLLSPLLDKGTTARRASVGVASAGTAALTLLMARDLKGLLLFPEAFGVLVLSKLYVVAKAALVPSMTSSEDDLASANAKLAVLAALAGFAVSPIGVAFLQLGAAWVLRLTFVVFIGCSFAAIRLPRTGTLPARAKPLGNLDDGRPVHGPPRPAPLPVAEAPAAETGMRGEPGGLIYQARARRRDGRPRVNVRNERRRLGLDLIVPEVTVALGAMSVLRGIFGFMTFFLAFRLREIGAATWWYGLILLVSGIGGLVGSMSVPAVRRFMSEQQLILACLIFTAAVATLTGLWGSIWAQPILAAAVGYSSTAAKPAFDSVAQHFVPPAALGRAFARFETQLQLCWVLSALLAVLIEFPFRAGDILIAAAAAIAAAFHFSMRHTMARRGSEDQPAEASTSRRRAGARSRSRRAAEA